ncbi:hypothetical protein EDC94DRAFT_592258 [Helicostylum pulchrum]|nr:hypothetical protein EDC94DRAFT_592258 [Helicostylum pulchrum]
MFEFGSAEITIGNTIILNLTINIFTLVEYKHSFFFWASNKRFLKEYLNATLISLIYTYYSSAMEYMSVRVLNIIKKRHKRLV